MVATHLCEENSPKSATGLLNAASDANTLKPYVNFGSTRFAIKLLRRIKVKLVRKITIPNSRSITFFNGRMKIGSAGGQDGVNNLEFFKI